MLCQRKKNANNNDDDDNNNIDDDNLAVEADHQKEDNVSSISMAAGFGVSDKDGSTFTAFKTLLLCGDIEDVSQCASDFITNPDMDCINLYC